MTLVYDDVAEIVLWVILPPEFRFIVFFCDVKRLIGGN